MGEGLPRVFLLDAGELLAIRDYIVHVLDKEGRREEQLAALGGAVSRMVLPPSTYTPLLGSGLDAMAAVAKSTMPSM